MPMIFVRIMILTLKLINMLKMRQIKKLEKLVTSPTQKLITIL